MLDDAWEIAAWATIAVSVAAIVGFSGAAARVSYSSAKTGRIEPGFCLLLCLATYCCRALSIGLEIATRNDRQAAKAMLTSLGYWMFSICCIFSCAALAELHYLRSRMARRFRGMAFGFVLFALLVMGAATTVTVVEGLPDATLDVANDFLAVCVIIAVAIWAFLTPLRNSLRKGLRSTQIVTRTRLRITFAMMVFTAVWRLTLQGTTARHGRNPLSLTYECGICSYVSPESQHYCCMLTVVTWPELLCITLIASIWISFLPRTTATNLHNLHAQGSTSGHHHQRSTGLHAPLLRDTDDNHSSSDADSGPLLDHPSPTIGRYPSQVMPIRVTSSNCVLQGVLAGEINARINSIQQVLREPVPDLLVRDSTPPVLQLCIMTSLVQAADVARGQMGAAGGQRTGRVTGPRHQEGAAEPATFPSDSERLLPKQQPGAVGCSVSTASDSVIKALRPSIHRQRHVFVHIRAIDMTVSPRPDTPPGSPGAHAEWMPEAKGGKGTGGTAPPKKKKKKKSTGWQPGRGETSFKTEVLKEGPGAYQLAHSTAASGPSAHRLPRAGTRVHGKAASDPTAGSTADGGDGCGCEAESHAACLEFLAVCRHEQLLSVRRAPSMRGQPCSRGSTSHSRRDRPTAANSSSAALQTSGQRRTYAAVAAAATPSIREQGPDDADTDSDAPSSTVPLPPVTPTAAGQASALGSTPAGTAVLHRRAAMSVSFPMPPVSTALPSTAEAHDSHLSEISGARALMGHETMQIELDRGGGDFISAPHTPYTSRHSASTVSSGERLTADALENGSAGDNPTPCMLQLHESMLLITVFEVLHPEGVGPVEVKPADDMAFCPLPSDFAANQPSSLRSGSPASGCQLSISSPGLMKRATSINSLHGGSTSPAREHSSPDVEMQCQSPNGRGTPADTSSVPTVPHHTVDLKELGLELSPEDERRVRRGRQRLGLRACATGVCTLAELLAAPTGSVDIAVHDVPVVTPVKAAKSAPTLPRAPTPPDSDVMEYVRLRVVALKRGRRERVTASADRLAPWDPKPAKLDPPDADGHFPSIKRWQRFTRWYQAVGSIARHPVVPLTAPATSAMTPAGTAIARSDTTGTSGVYREPTRLLIEEDIRESAYTFSVPAQMMMLYISHYIKIYHGGYKAFAVLQDTCQQVAQEDSMGAVCTYSQLVLVQQQLQAYLDRVYARIETLQKVLHTLGVRTQEIRTGPWGTQHPSVAPSHHSESDAQTTGPIPINPHFPLPATFKASKASKSKCYKQHSAKVQGWLFYPTNIHVQEMRVRTLERLGGRSSFTAHVQAGDGPTPNAIHSSHSGRHHHQPHPAAPEDREGCGACEAVCAVEHDTYTWRPFAAMRMGESNNLRRHTEAAEERRVEMEQLDLTSGVDENSDDEHDDDLTGVQQRGLKEVVYDTITVGAFAAHGCGYNRKASLLALDGVQEAELRQTLNSKSEDDICRRFIYDWWNNQSRDMEDTWRLYDRELRIRFRQDEALSQATAALVTAFVRKLRLMQRYFSPTETRKLLNLYREVGFLFSVQSLLSSFRREAVMVDDFAWATWRLSRFKIRLELLSDADVGKLADERERQDYLHGLAHVHIEHGHPPAPAHETAGHHPASEGASHCPVGSGSSAGGGAGGGGGQDGSPLPQGASGCPITAYTIHVRLWFPTGSDGRPNGSSARGGGGADEDSPLPSRTYSTGSGQQNRRRLASVDGSSVADHSDRDMIITVFPVIYCVGINPDQIVADWGTPFRKAGDHQHRRINMESMQYLQEYHRRYVLHYAKLTYRALQKAKVNETALRSLREQLQWFDAVSRPEGPTSDQAARRRASSVDRDSHNTSSASAGGVGECIPIWPFARKQRERIRRRSSSGGRTMLSMCERLCSALDDVDHSGLTPPQQVEFDRRQKKLEKLASLVVTMQEVSKKQSLTADQKVELMETVHTFARLVHGGIVTACKSAKDRTAMSVTYDNARVVRREFGVSGKAEVALRTCMRYHGVRREVIEKSIGSRSYALSNIPVLPMPEAFRPPPASTSPNLET